MGGVALALLVLVSGGATSNLALPYFGRSRASEASPGLDGALTESALRTAVAADPWSAPPCIGDTCQPPVSIPGWHEPKIDMRGKRTEFFVSALEHMNAGFVATVARSMATTGIRLEYRPPQAQDAIPGHRNPGRIELMVRWRLDSWHGPVWQVARSP